MTLLSLLLLVFRGSTSTLDYLSIDDYFTCTLPKTTLGEGGDATSFTEPILAFER